MKGDKTRETRCLLQRRKRDAGARARDYGSVGVEMDDTGFFAAKTLVARKAGDHRHGRYQISLESRGAATTRNRHRSCSDIRVCVAALLEWGSRQDGVNQVGIVASSLRAGRWSQRSDAGRISILVGR